MEVLCDRYVDATIVYQGYARGLDLEVIRHLHEILCGGLIPDLTLLLDLPAEVGLRRAWKQLDHGTRTSSEARFEQEELKFHEKVRDGYLELARKEPARYRIIDATRTEEQVRLDIMETLFP
jgi:dTMP kinase